MSNYFLDHGKKIFISIKLIAHQLRQKSQKSLEEEAFKRIFSNNTVYSLDTVFHVMIFLPTFALENKRFTEARSPVFYFPVCLSSHLNPTILQHFPPPNDLV